MGRRKLRDAAPGDIGVVGNVTTEKSVQLHLETETVIFRVESRHQVYGVIGFNGRTVRVAEDPDRPGLLMIIPEPGFKQFWTTKDKRRIRIDKLEDQHLVNIVRMHRELVDLDRERVRRLRALFSGVVPCDGSILDILYMTADIIAAQESVLHRDLLEECVRRGIDPDTWKPDGRRRKLDL